MLGEYFDLKFIFFVIYEYLTSRVFLQDFKNETLSGRKFIWQLSSVPNLRGFLNAVKDDFNRQICTEVIDSFDNDVLQIADKLEKVIIFFSFMKGPRNI